MEKTSNYAIFKFCESNRKIDPLNVRKIKNSILSKNLLKYRPILVNSKMEVIDGQHRLKAAEELGVEIYYEIQREATVEDIVLLNANQKSWNAEDFLNYYCSRHSVEYLKFQEFMRKQNVSFRWALRLLRATRESDLFKSGGFKFPSDEFVSNAVYRNRMLNDIFEFIKSKSIRENKILKSSKFKEALFDFLNKDEVDLEIFMKRLEINLDKLKPCAAYSGYLMLLCDIYNYKNKNPISIYRN